HGIGVERQAFHVPAPVSLAPRLHHPFGVGGVAVARTDGYALHRVRRGLLLGVEAAHEAGVTPEQVGVVFRPHVAATAPGLVADAEVPDLPRLLAAIGRAFAAGGSALVGGDVGDPVGRFLDRPRTDVDRDVGFGADLLDEVEELVRAERVVLDRLAPVPVDAHAALRAIADPVAPVVLVGEAPAGPAHVWHADLAQRGDDVAANAADIGDFRILADPHAAVDPGTEMLGELAEDVAGDLRAGLSRIDRHRRRCVLRGRRDRNGCQGRYDAGQQSRTHDGVLCEHVSWRVRARSTGDRSSRADRACRGRRAPR